jgi:hypothetical protein
MEHGDYRTYAEEIPCLIMKMSVKPWFICVPFELRERLMMSQPLLIVAGQFHITVTPKKNELNVFFKQTYVKK